MVRKKLNKELQNYYQKLWIGFFLMFPILFFNGPLKETRWFDIFGIISLIGAAIAIYSFIRIIQIKKRV